MDLSAVLATVRKHKWLFAIAMVAGVALGVLALFQLSITNQRHLIITPRRTGTYSTSVSLLIEDSNYGLGRTTEEGIARGAQLAPTYAYLATSEPVLRLVRSRVGNIREAVVGSAVRDSPVVRIAVEGSDPDRVPVVAAAAGEGLRAYIRQYQIENSIPDYERVSLRILGKPEELQVVTSRGTEIAAILFLAPFLVAFLIAATLENLSSAARKGLNEIP